MKLFLIGLMGSGKSFLGKKISEALHLPFIDLDSEIEKEEGRSVSEVFSTQGEEYFRKLEAAVLRKASEVDRFVMATGGGAPCFHQNMKFIKKTGTSVFLDVPVTIIARRLNESQKNKRPILQNSTHNKIEDTLANLLSERLKFYKQADFTLGGEITESDILELLNSKKYNQT
jgi:shikimate kinase